MAIWLVAGGKRIPREGLRRTWWGGNSRARPFVLWGGTTKTQFLPEFQKSFPIQEDKCPVGPIPV